MTPSSKFFRTLYSSIVDRNGDLDDEYELEIRPFDVISQPHLPKDRLQGLRGQTYIGLANVDEAAASAVEHDRMGRECYFGVHPRRRGTAASGNEAVPVYTSLMADVDVVKHGLEEASVLAVLAASPWGRPSVVIRSGGGLHVYWVYREPVDATDPDERAKHEDAAHLIRWHINTALKTPAADEMGTRDRILRIPGTHNWKRDRRQADGTAPTVELLEADGARFVTHDHVLSFGPTDIDWRSVGWDAKTGAEKKRDARSIREPLDPNSLPKTLPEMIKRVVVAAGIRIAKLKADASTGGLSLFEVSKCPACGDTRGKCFITVFGRLKSHRQDDCPAGKTQAGDYGIGLKQWVFRFAPQAKSALERDDVGPLKRPMEHRVAIAWGELSVEAGDGTARKWLDAAGFHPDLGDEAINEGILLCPIPELLDAKASRLAHGIANARRDGEVLVPVQDVEGATRIAAWLDTQGNVRTLSHLDIETLGDLPQGLGVLGDLPTAVVAGSVGRTIVVASDPRDWLTAQAMRHAGVLDAEILGVLRQRDMPIITQVLKRRWTAMGALPRRVVLLRRREGKGTIAHEAAKRLVGRAGVAICDLTTPKPHQGGLTESAATFGPESAARAINTAPWRYEPPIDIRTSGPAVASFLEQSMGLAMAKTTHGRRKLVVCVVDAGAGKTSAMLQVGAKAHAGLYDIPVNGRRPNHVDPANWPPKGRRIGFWLPNHALALEKHEQLMGMERAGMLEGVHTLNAVHLKGALEWCAFKAHVRDVFPVVGRRGICGDPDSEQRCPEAAEGCLGSIEPRIEYGQIAFGAHAMAANVKQDLAIVDESPGVFDEQAVDSVAFASLFTPRILHRVKKWRTVENEDAPLAARLLSDAVQARANEHADDIGAGRADGYEKHIRGKDLVELIDGTKGLVEALRVGAHKDARKPPVPFPNELRAGAFALSSYPSRAAFYALQALWAHYCRLKGVTPDPEGEQLVVLDNTPATPEPIVVVALSPDRTWSVQQIQIRRLPECPVVMLDATGEITLDEWKAAYPDRDVVVRRMRVQGTAPAMALHLETRQFRRRRIWGQDGTLTEKTAARLRSSITRTVLETRRKVPSSPGERPLVGVLLYKGLYDLISGATPPRNVPEQIVAGIGMLTEDLGVNVRWGYFGKHDRGTNEFEGVAALLVIGDPLENLGHVDLQAGVLGLDADKIGRHRAEATLVQAIFRARHTRRDGPERPPVVLVHVGERPPDIDGLDWDKEPLIEHQRPHTAGKLALAYAAVEYVAEQLDDVVGAKLMQWFDFSGSPFGRKIQDEVDERTWRDACRRYAQARRLVETPVPLTDRRPAVMFGPSAEKVLEVAEIVFSLKRPRNEDPCGKSGFSDPENTPNSDKNRQETTGRSIHNPAPQAISGEVRLLVIEKGGEATSEGISEARRPPETPPDREADEPPGVVTAWKRLTNRRWMRTVTPMHPKPTRSMP